MLLFLVVLGIVRCAPSSAMPLTIKSNPRIHNKKLFTALLFIRTRHFLIEKEIYKKKNTEQNPVLLRRIFPVRFIKFFFFRHFLWIHFVYI